MAERRWFHAIPLDLAVATGFGAVASIATSIAALASDHDRMFPSSARWNMFGYGAGLATSIVIIIGLLELRRTTTGGRASLLLAAAIGRGITTAWTLAWPFVSDYVVEHTRDSPQTFFEITGLVQFVLYLATSAVIVCAARPWRSTAGWIALVVIALMSVPGLPYLQGVMWGYMFEHPRARFAYMVTWAILSLAWLVIYGLIARDAQELGDGRRATRACRRAAWWLYARIIVAVGIALLAMMQARSPSLVMTLLLATAGGTLVTMGGFAASLLGLGHARVPGIPVLRLYVAAYVTLWWTLIQIDQAQLLFRGHGGGEFGADLDELAAWSAIGPCAMALAIGFGASALRGVAAMRSDAVHGDIVVTRLGWYIAFALAGALLPVVARPTTPEGLILVAVAAVGFGVGALVALAKLFADAAERVALASAADVF